MDTQHQNAITPWLVIGSIIILGAIIWIMYSPPQAPMNESKTFSLASNAFKNGETIPSTYTCEGTPSRNPPLSISGVPEGTKSLALLLDDPDVPKQIKPDGVFDHWVLFNIPRTATSIEEGSSVGIVGANGLGKNEYFGPCPPLEYEPSEHRYFFKLYALDTELALAASSTKQDVLNAMKGHIISETELTGKYRKQKGAQ